VTSAPDATASVALTLSAGAGVLNGTTNVTAVAGLATFTDLSLTVPGSDKVLTAAATLMAGTKTTNSPVFAITYLTWTAQSNNAWDINTSSNWNSFNKKYQDALPILFDDSASSGVVTLNTNAAPAGMTVSNATKTYAISGSGGIGGTNGLTKLGSGALTLGTTNSFSGGTIVRDGTLLAATNDALGALSGAVILGDSGTGPSDAPALLTKGAVVVVQPITVNSTNCTLGGSTADASSYTNTLTLNRDLTLSAVANGEVTFSGAVTGGSNITVTGAGIVRLTQTDYSSIGSVSLSFTNTDLTAGGRVEMPNATLNINNATLTVDMGGLSGNSYTVAVYSALSGTFAVTNGSLGSYQVGYGANAITLSLGGVPVLTSDPSVSGVGTNGATLGVTVNNDGGNTVTSWPCGWGSFAVVSIPSSSYMLPIRSTG